MPTATTTKPKRDLYADITHTLIDQIERNPGTPQMPWRRTGGQPLWMPVNACTQAHYRGINTVVLWAIAEMKGYKTPIWATYRQWQAMGAQVRGGEKSTLVVKYGQYELSEAKREQAGTGDDDDGKRLYVKGYAVFNAEQVDGFTLPPEPERLGPVERIARADAFMRNTGANIIVGGERACYVPSTDTIHMPDEGLFTGTDTMSRSEAWHAVELHEGIHWTLPAERCNRALGKRFQNNERAAEELVAEIGSAMLCAKLEVTQDVRPDHAQYLAHWLELMKGDPKAIFTAAAAASRAVDYLVSLQPPGFFPEPARASADTPGAEESASAPVRDAATDANTTRQQRPMAKRAAP